MMVLYPDFSPQIFEGLGFDYYCISFSKKLNIFNHQFRSEIIMFITICEEPVHVSAKEYRPDIVC